MIGKLMSILSFYQCSQHILRRSALCTPRLILTMCICYGHDQVLKGPDPFMIHEIDEMGKRLGQMLSLL